MLRLKRASAGSGKTYELAKMYIKLLLTFKSAEGARLLRHESNLREALKSIMAVTFTVKATAEMKERIVEKLSELSGAYKAKTDEEIKKIDYLEEFIDDLGLPKDEIARLASEALRILLLHYSDFKVQTIDSFFQSILHTFAYEASLEDGFNMEVDTDYITSVGFDSMLDELSDSDSKSTAEVENLRWLKEVMEESLGSTSWNVFARKDSNSSLYTKLIYEAKNLEKESYQARRQLLYDYFTEAGPRFVSMVEEVEEANISPWRHYHDNRRLKALTLKEELGRAGLEPRHIFGGRPGRLLESLEEFYSHKILPPEIEIKIGKGGKVLSNDGEKLLAQNIAKNPGLNSTVYNDIESAYKEWMQANNEYKEEFEKNSKAFNTWLQYRAMLPKLMVVLDIAGKKDAYLKSTNSLQISDTAHILSRIIGDTDVPFVYERMGSRLNHYLIDEFQDTSRLQWNNLYPLLSESDSTGNDNLIIGDAKQSIYRFRNADSRLINEMGGKFGDIRPYTTEKPPKDSRPVNTNFRSKPCIVGFNNFVFSNIVNLKTSDTDEDVFSETVKTTYADCVQALPEKKNDGRKAKGYVELTLSPKISAEERNKYPISGKTSLGELGFRELPEKILELKERGYDFKDIAVLVKSHEHGMAAIEVINIHNSRNPEKQIPVISEENLLVSSALSVRLVIHALEMAAGNASRKTKSNTVLNDPIGEDELAEVLGSLPSMALPSVTEALFDRFVPSSRRRAEAPFIAAFQDAVIDYSSSKSSDIGTFLKWWRQKSKSLSITSSEDSDGVRLQTIHKSKGLEFKCVIMPMAAFSFDPFDHYSEWRWVIPSPEVKKSELLPPFIPVETGKNLEETVHSDIRREYCEEFALDELNKMYVAFTRAVDELYIYANSYAKDAEKRSGGALEKLFVEQEDGQFSVTGSSDERLVIKCGEPLSAGQIAEEKEKDARKIRNRVVEKIADYEIRSQNKALRVSEENRLLRLPVHTSVTESEINPRAEGTLKHRIMQMVNVPADLDKSLRAMNVRGLVSKQQVEEWGAELREAIRSVGDRGWFAENVRVITERPLIKNNSVPYRPDRIVVTDDGKAAVIDYKFGEEEKKHISQVKGYAELLRQTGSFGEVSSFLWYIPQAKIIKVD